MAMLTPEAIRARAERLWTGPKLLAAAIEGETLFPWSVALAPPASGQLLERFSAVREWVAALRAHSHEQLGYGYRLEYRALNHRQLGPQQIPTLARFDSIEELLRFIDREADYRRFLSLADTLLQAQPSLRDWLITHPHQLLTQAEAWPRLLAVIDYLQRRPRPGCYLRELPIAGIDSKFIETHRGLLRDLLNSALPASAIDAGETALTAGGFERRFGLAYDQPLLRLRWLDPQRPSPWRLDDISLPLDAFRALDPPIRRLFITENKVNGLSFPPHPGAMVLFGLGYGIHALEAVPWLAGCEIHYWGDIDSHGFAILAALRRHHPQVRSLLMDRDTLLAHGELWGEEPEGKRHLAELEGLTPEEAELFDELRNDRIRPRLRLEQERIDFTCLTLALSRLATRG